MSIATVAVLLSLLLVLNWVESSTDQHHTSRDSLAIRLDGDIIVGGLFPIHDDATGLSGLHCGTIKEDKGIQRLEAMLYAIDEVNKKEELLPGVKLGVHIRDTCSQETHALEQTLEFIKSSMSTDYSTQYQCIDNTIPTRNTPKPIVGVIGAASSTVSLMVANILGLFKIPQISYSATSSSLSDKTKYPFFSRVVPPDDLQAQALVDIVESLGWTYVSAIAEEGQYGEKGAELFKKLGADRNICFATLEKLRSNFQDSDYRRVIERLNSPERRYTRGVIIFASEDHVKKTHIDSVSNGFANGVETFKLLKAVRVLRLQNRFNWVASDSWGEKRHAVSSDPKSAEGAITILPKKRVVQTFDAYFKQLSIDNNRRNVWYGEYYKQRFNCTTAVSCRKAEIAKKHVQEGYVPFVIEAVYLLAHALNAMITQVCPDVFSKVKRQKFANCSLATKGFDGYELLQFIRNASFKAVEGEPVTLDEKGDRKDPTYDIYQFRGAKKDYKYVRIGDWGSNGLRMNLSSVIAAFNGSIPESVCDQPCGIGKIQRHQQGTCCWICTDCTAKEIVVNQTCIPCPLGKMPNWNRSECEDVPVEFMEWDSLWAIIPAAFSSIGVCATLFVTAIFIRYNNTPIVMASGRELCYIMLFGIFLSYAITYLLILKPNAVLCGLLRVGVGFSLCICYAAIFTKTNRLARIFTNNIKSVKRPQFISPRSQIVFCFLLTSVQLVGAIVWIIAVPPQPKITYPDDFRAILTCSFTATATPLILSQVYNMFLIVLCTVYAVKTRKIPENFNETKHIGFTMYSTCIVWLAFVPIYFGTTNNFRIQTTSLCICVSVCATVALLCFFAPKVYIVLFQPHKNIRQGTPMTKFQKLQMDVLRQQMRFVRSAVDPDAIHSSRGGELEDLSSTFTSGSATFVVPVGGAKLPMSNGTGGKNGDFQFLTTSSGNNLNIPSMAKSKSSQFYKTPLALTAESQVAENQLSARRTSRSWSFSDRLSVDQSTPLNSGLSQTRVEVSPTRPTAADGDDDYKNVSTPDVHQRIDTLVVCSNGPAEVELILDEINMQEGTDL